MAKSRWAAGDQAFGFMLAVLSIAIGAHGYWRGRDSYSYFLYAAILFLVMSLTVPSVLTPFRIRWMWLGENIGKVTTPIVMAFLFYVPLTSLSLLMRLFGAIPMKVNFENGPSYWKTRDKSHAQDFRKQF